MSQKKYQEIDDRESRINADVDRISQMCRDPDSAMAEILEILTDVDVVPEVGKYYTFIYKAKTDRIQYDEFPLIACVAVYKWGFTGINYHWGDYRQYTWEELRSNLHIVHQSEIRDMRQIPYQSIKLNT